ncbi:MAG: DNA-binding response regulator [Candidatus Latescibacterota bacterium]
MHAAPPSSLPESASAVTPRILIVEDDAAVARLWRDFLVRRGMQAQAVASAEEAQRKLCETSFDLLVLDLRLQGRMDGLGLLGAMAARALPPVILVSAYLTAEVVARAVRLRAAKVLRKPCPADDLYLSARWVLLPAHYRSPVAFLRSQFRLVRSLAHLSRIVEQHPRTLTRHIKAQTGHTFDALLSELRVQEAERLLLETDLTINKIAARLHFTLRGLERALKRRTGATPRQYRGRALGRVGGSSVGGQDVAQAEARAWRPRARPDARLRP